MIKKLVPVTLPNQSVPVLSSAAFAAGMIDTDWYQALRGIADRLNGPQRVPEYAVAKVPAAANYQNCVIRITGTAGLALSDGVNWRRISDNGIIL